MRKRWLAPLLLLTSTAVADPGLQPALRSQSPSTRTPGTKLPEEQAAASGVPSAGDAPAPPPAFVTGTPSTVRVPGDKPLWVLHAPPEIQRAIIYLHGWCGRPEAPEAFKQTLARHGTLIALTADMECPNGRTKWSKNTHDQHERIQRALQIVKQKRGGALDLNDIVLFGYSQGAARAYRLSKAHAASYPRLILGGPPEPPSMEYLSRARALAVLGGELETTERMRQGTADVQEAGKLARYFTIPSAKHGDYGPLAEQVMEGVFSWLLRVAP
jgi:pimeloyl-ACP methyl ester carboxylesterase